MGMVRQSLTSLALAGSAMTTLAAGRSMTTLVEGGGGPLSAWAWSAPVQVDNTGGAAKTDYQVFVDLTSANFDFTHAQSNGEDIRFYQGETLLPHWRQNWDSGSETARLVVRVPSILANTDDPELFRMYFGNDEAADGSSIVATYIFGDDFTDLSRLRGLPDQEYTDRQGSVGVVLGSKSSSIVTQSNNTWKHTVREPSNIIYDPTDTGREFKFYFTGRDNGGINPQIGLAYASAIDGSWTEYVSNPVISEGEDPYICRNIDGSLYRDGSGNMHLFCEDGPNEDILHYYSADGISWTADPNNPVLVRGTASAWDDTLVGSPIVMHTGSDEFIMVYEGRTTGPNDRTGIARKSGNLDGTGWTKEATNPVSTVDVPDDLIWTGTKWIFMAHGTASETYRYETTDTNPDDWDSSSFVELGPNPLLDATKSFNAGPLGADGFGTKMVVLTGNDSFELYDVLGTDEWAFERLSTLLLNVPYENVLFDVDGSTLVMDPNGQTADLAMIAYTKGLALTNDIAIMVRKKAEVDGSDDALTQIAIGSGVPTNTAATHIPNFPNGYHFHCANPGAGSDFTIREFGSGSFTATLDTGSMSAAQANNFAVHELSYLSDGSLAYSIDGTGVLSATDTTHLSTEKEIMLSQGNRHSATLYGAKQTVDWVAVRKYDGDDPSTTVGSETAN